MPRAVFLLLVLLAGCTAPAPEGTEADDVGGADARGGIETVAFAGSVEVAVASPVATANTGDTFRADLPARPDRTGYVVEVAWQPTAPANERLSLWVRASAAGSPLDPGSVLAPTPPLHRVDGASPLRLVVPADDLDESASYAAMVRAAGAADVVGDVGAAAAQPFEMRITVFDGVPLDEGFSAFAAPTAA